MYKLEHVPTNRHQLVHRITIWILVPYKLAQIWQHMSSMGWMLGYSNAVCGQKWAKVDTCVVKICPFLPFLCFLWAHLSKHIYMGEDCQNGLLKQAQIILYHKKSICAYCQVLSKICTFTVICAHKCVFVTISLPVWIGIGKWQSSRGWWRWVDNDDDEGEVGGDPHHPVQGDHLVQGDEEEEEEEGEEGWGVERWCWVTGKPPLWVGSCSWNLILSYQYIVILDQIYSDHQWRPLMTWTMAPAGPPTLGWQR